MPETYVKNRRAEIREYEETLIAYRGKLELLERQRRERADSRTALRSSLDSARNEISGLIEQRDRGRDADADTRKLEELNAHRNELLAGPGDTSANNTMSELVAKARKLETSIAEQAAKPYVSEYSSQIAEAEAGLKLLYAEHKRMKTALANIAVGYRCPV
jgi:chromosome segregation ATPase